MKSYLNAVFLFLVGAVLISSVSEARRNCLANEYRRVQDLSIFQLLPNTPVQTPAEIIGECLTKDFQTSITIFQTKDIVGFDFFNEQCEPVKLQSLNTQDRIKGTSFDKQYTSTKAKLGMFYLNYRNGYKDNGRFALDNSTHTAIFNRIIRQNENAMDFSLQLDACSFDQRALDLDAD